MLYGNRVLTVSVVENGFMIKDTVDRNIYVFKTIDKLFKFLKDEYSRPIINPKV